MSIILECPNCLTRYDLPVELPSEGRKVRCANCAHVWHATEIHIVTEAPPELAHPEAVVPENDIDFEDFEDEIVEEPEAKAAEGGVSEDESPAPDPWEDEAETDLERDPFETAPDEDAWAETDDFEVEAGDEEDVAPPDEEDESPGPLPPAEMPDRERPTVDIGKARRLGAGAAVAAGWLMLIALVVGVSALAVWKRVDVVRVLPGTAKVYAQMGLPVNVRGLQFEKVEFKWSVEAGRPTLEVHGDIVNVTAEPMKVPTVVFALLNEADVEVYQWAADVRNDLLGARDRTRFVARIPTPPKSIRSVQVRFAKAR